MGLRQQLWAYTKVDCCRLAAILRDLLPETKAGIEREELWRYWDQRHPRHKVHTEKKNRVTNALSYLRAAGIVENNGSSVKVVRADRLEMAADNLKILQDKRGEAVHPNNWSRRPAVPKHLEATQLAAEASRVSRDG